MSRYGHVLGAPHILKFSKLSDDAFMPYRVTPLSAGMDLCSPKPYLIRPYKRLLIKLDLQVEIPIGYYGKLESKSGLTLTQGYMVGAGVIDQDFTGNLGVIVFNMSKRDIRIQRGDAIAQMLLIPIALSTPLEEHELYVNDRQEGFGYMDRQRNSRVAPDTAQDSKCCCNIQ